MALLAFALLAFALLGALDALYFVLVTYRVLPPDTRLVPAVCRMDEDRCARIVDTCWARVLGVPNALIGLVWYLLVAAAAVAALAGVAVPWGGFLFGAVAAVVLSVVLFWSLVWRLRVPCPLCFFGHGVNVVVLVLVGSLSWPPGL